MKQLFWKPALICGLALSLSSIGAFARAEPKPGRGGEKGGDKPQVNRGAMPHPRGAGATQPARGGSPHVSGQGGIHAPAMPGPHQSSGNGRQQAIMNRTPSFSRPNISRPNIGDRRNVTTHPPVTVHPAMGDRIGNSSGVKGPGAGISETRHPSNPGTRGDVSSRTEVRRFESNRASITNRPFVGNTVNFNNRTYNVAHSSYQPAYYRHSGYHGYWNGNRGFGGSSFGAGLGYGLGSGLGYGVGSNLGYGWGLGGGSGYGRGYGGYGYRPFGWGWGGWGLGSMMYSSGYLGYSNPYYIAAGPVVYNYAQPIPVSYNITGASAIDPNSSDDVLNNAIAAFKQNDYDAALDITNQGIAQFPDDAVLHEFRALVLFARHDYQQAAATIHSVLAVGPGWDWTTLSSMYSSIAIYTDQFRALEAFTQQNPGDAAGRFLLAYHDMSCGHPDAAARELRHVVRLMPNDRVAADLLKMVSAPPSGQPDETAERPSPQPPQELTRPAAEPVDPAMLVGTWNATRPDGSEFKLTMTNDSKFTWSFTQGNQAAQNFGGTFSVEGNVLALERKDGGSLIAAVIPSGNRRFNFKLLGASDADPGLDFSR